MGVHDGRGGSKLSPTKATSKNANSQTSFDPVHIKVKTIDTVILLLKSKETDVILQAVVAADRAVRKSPELLHSLLEQSAMDALLGLASHAHINVRRFSLKLSAQLSRLATAQRRLAKDDAVVSSFVHILVKGDDEVSHEFSSFVLSELTSNSAEACQLVMRKDIVDCLFTRIKSPDPDLQKNCVQLMENLLRDPAAYKTFTLSRGFSFEPLLSLLGSEYPVIQQLAAAVLDTLTRHASDTSTQALFRRASGVERVLDVLEKAEWKDLHQEVLRVLVNSAQDPETAQYIHRSGGLRRLLELVDRGNSVLEGVLAVVARIADTESGREALYESKVPELLVRLLKGGVAAACTGIALLTQHRASLASLVALDPVEGLVAVLWSDQRPWESRRAAAHALCQLVHLDRSAALQLLHNNHLEVIVSLLGKQIPVELSMKLIHCLTNLAMYEDIRSAKADHQMIETILSYLEEGEQIGAELMVAALECMSVLMSEAQVRDVLLVSSGVLRIANCLRHRSVPLAHAAAAVVQLAAADPQLAAAFVQAGALQWMMDRPEMRAVVPVWSTAMEALFNSHLPAKLAFRGHLEVTDVTREGFYVHRHPHKKFLTLEELLAARACPISPIYVCNFENAAPPPTPVSKNAGRKTRQPNKKTPSNYDMEEAKVSLKNHVVCLPDPHLPQYLQQLKKMLMISKEPQRTSEKSMEEQIRTVARFVADQMSGRDPDEACDTHQLELHLYQLKVSLETSIIPLGYVRVGGHLERAVLFKVLADRLGLPCALVRGQYSRSWIEVPLCQPDHTTCRDASRAMPLRLLRPNHIVDLMYNVGQLLPLHTHDADVYIGKPTHSSRLHA